MSDEKKVSRFPGRRSVLATAVAAAIMKDQPTIGGPQGDFVREKCGSCLSWRRDSRAGKGPVPLNAGQCMFMPPTPFPMFAEGGVMVGTILIRPNVTSDSEGCDQHDDGTDDEEGEGEPGSLIAQAG
jgi:hypothetical protein